MLKAEINYLFKQMNMNIRDHPYLKIVGSRGNWTFRDNRTINQWGYDRVYPIGINQSSIYVINPRTGNVETHGFTGKDYTGHRSQGYVIEDLTKAKKLTIGDLKIIRRMNSYKRLNEKYKIN